IVFVFVEKKTKDIETVFSSVFLKSRFYYDIPIAQKAFQKEFVATFLVDVADQAISINYSRPATRVRQNCLSIRLAIFGHLRKKQHTCDISNYYTKMNRIQSSIPHAGPMHPYSSAQFLFALSIFDGIVLLLLLAFLCMYNIWSILFEPIDFSLACIYARNISIYIDYLLITEVSLNAALLKKIEKLSHLCPYLLMLFFIKIMLAALTGLGDECTMETYLPDRIGDIMPSEYSEPLQLKKGWIILDEHTAGGGRSSGGYERTNKTRKVNKGITIFVQLYAEVVKKMYMLISLSSIKSSPASTQLKTDYAVVLVSIDPGCYVLYLFSLLASLLLLAIDLHSDNILFLTNSSLVLFQETACDFRYSYKLFLSF
ncbi:hypothetical protein ACJX0J_013622, partial [Zea mays]